MNIRTQLLITHSKNNTNKIVDYIGNDIEKLADLMNCFFSAEYRVNQRSAMAVSALFDKDEKMMQPYISQMIANLDNENIHVAVRRNTIRILQFVKYPEQQIAALFDHCLSYLIEPKEPIAVKAFSMAVLYNICKIHPALKAEVMPLLEEELERTDSTGVKSRGRKVLYQLQQL